MTAAISRASVWSEFGQLIVDGTLPDPESIRFQPGMVAVALDNAGDLFAWAEHVGARVDGSGVNFSDSTGHWLTSAHAWGWHGWTVQLWTVNGNELHRPEDLPGAGEEVAGPGAGSATAPAETDVWVPIRRRGTNYHRPGGQRSTACGRNMFPNGVRLPVDQAIVFGAVPCPRCYGGAA